MECLDVIDNVWLMAEQKKKGIVIMVSSKDKQLFEKAAAKDERTLADWLRFVARQRARDLGFDVDASPRPKKKKTED
jgi:hypothetical protein